MVVDEHRITGRTDHHYHGDYEEFHGIVMSNETHDYTTLDDIIEKIGDGKIVEVTIKVLA